MRQNRKDIDKKCPKVKCEKMLKKVKKVKTSVDFIQQTNLTELENLVTVLQDSPAGNFWKPLSGSVNVSTDIFNDAMTNARQKVIVNCCHPNNTVALASCGLGVSCEDCCKDFGASLCPSGDCSGNCEWTFQNETESVQETIIATESISNGDETQTIQGQSVATNPSHAFALCSPRCDIEEHNGCCYNPVCQEKIEICNTIVLLTNGGGLSSGTFLERKLVQKSSTEKKCISNFLSSIISCFYRFSHPNLQLVTLLDVVTSINFLIH